MACPSGILDQDLHLPFRGGVAVLFLCPSCPLGLTNPPGGSILAHRTRRGLEVLQGLAHPAGAGGLQRRVLASKGCKRRVQAAGSPQISPRRLQICRGSQSSLGSRLGFLDFSGFPGFCRWDSWDCPRVWAESMAVRTILRDNPQQA